MSDKNLHVAAAIIVRDGKVLAARRSDGAEGWELPGGKIEPSETAEDACRREVREELALELGVLWPYTTVRHAGPELDLAMDVFDSMHM